MNYQELYKSKLCTPQDVAKSIRPNDGIFLSPVAGTPFDILDAMVEIYEELENVQLHSAFMMRPMPFHFDPDFKNHITYYSFFMGALERKVHPMGSIKHSSVHFSELDVALKNPDYNINTLMAGVSPMDEDGYFYYGPMGVSSCGTVASMPQVDKIVVQVTSTMPRTNGEFHRVHINDVSMIVEQDFPLADFPEAPVSDLDRAIAAYLVPRVPDGCTLQVGLGGLANAVAYSLEDKKNLGVHTEMITESMMYLAQKGVISRKIIGGFALGTEKLYKFAGENDQIFLSPIHLVNKPEKIAEYDSFVSINSCLMSDLTGQIASEGVGFRPVSSTGGAADYVRGASHSKNGQSFLCLASTAVDKEGNRSSNIVLALPPGTPVTIQRSDVQYVVTEYGIADLYQKNIEERVTAMISIAHPDFREELHQQALEAKLIFA